MRLTRRGAAVALALLSPFAAITAQGAPVLDSAAADAFIKQYMAGLRGSDAVPRAAFVLVHGASITLAKGFGKTAANTPVDPARTLFRAASNSKLITATAVMQLAEQGRWKLDDDINRYLPPAARIDATFAAPVTLHQLLTHTSGFEDRFAGGLALQGKGLSLAEYFARNRPRRAMPAGVEVSYSNTGIALAGYLVERASGEPFAQYAKRHIFDPLGMSRSSFEQPVPAEWRADLAGGAPTRARDIHFNPYPAASLVTAPIDMGRFIAAHLSGGGRVLSAASVADMHATHWRAQPSAPGVAYGFFEGMLNGHRALFHTGDSGDHSVVLLLPDDAVGFYFVYTGTDEQASVREHLTRAFVDRFFPAPAGVAPAPALAAGESLEELAGTFRGARYSRSNYEKVKAMFNQVRVRPDGPGALAVQPPGDGAPVHLVRVAPLTFRGDSGEMVAFRRGADGRIAGFTLGGSIWDPSSWDRVGALENGTLHFRLALIAILIVAARGLVWPVVALIRRVSRATPRLSNPRERRWWRWSGLVAALLLLTPIIALATAFLSFTHPVVAVPRAMGVAGALLIVAMIAGLPLLPAAAIVWRDRMWTPARRVHFTLVALAMLVLAPMLAYWRLLG